MLDSQLRSRTLTADKQLMSRSNSDRLWSASELARVNEGQALLYGGKYILLSRREVTPLKRLTDVSPMRSEL